MKRIRSRTAEKMWRHPFPIISLWGCFSDVQGQLTPQSVVQQAEIQTRPSSHACHRYLQLLKGMYEKQPSKSGDTVFPIITISLPWKPVFRSGGISNSSKLSCMLSLPASMKRIRLRTAEKKWRHHFSNYKPMGIFSDFQGQLTPKWVVQSS